MALRPGKRKALPDTPLGRLQASIEQDQARIRATVEQPFRVIKRQFGFFRTRCRGLPKDTAQIVSLLALANLFQARHRSAMRGEALP